MTSDRAWLRRVRHGWQVSADLVAVLTLVVVANLLVLHTGFDSPLARAVVGIAYVVFIPGYALVSALFPEAGGVSTAGGRGPDGKDRGRAGTRDSGGPTDGPSTLVGRVTNRRRITDFERAALSFGLSIALVPLLLVGLSLSPFAFELVPILSTINAATVIGVGVAAIRRWSLPAGDRFRLPYPAWLAAGKRSVTRTDTRFGAGVNVALAFSVLLAVGTLTFTVVSPAQGEQYTEFYVLTENGEGELVASNYPESLSPGEPVGLHFGIENYEKATVEYVVVVQLQRVQGTANESGVDERVEVDRFSMELSHNETSIREREVAVSDELTGEGLRMTFLLYADSVPDTPTRDNAYQDLHIWVDVGP